MLEIGQKAPDFTLPDDRGGSFSLSRRRGNPVVVDVVFEGAAAAIAAAVYGGVPLAALEADGAVKVTGDRALAGRFTTLFPLPPRASRPGATS